jgi:phenylalanyl-tRNA synthetase beta chain
MKVSLNTVKEFTDVSVSADELVGKIGAQLGAVEAVYESGAKYDGVVVVRVVSCEKHPDADKLSVCWIDDGGVVKDVERNNDGYVQVVCGAPNAREGVLVAWLPPGSVVPSTYWSDRFILSAREIRGVVSNGMLASPSELAISDLHDGILEINENIAPGTPFKTLYSLDDVIIEIENKMFTHRPDCFGILGVAREIAGIQGRAFNSPDWYKNKPEFKSANQLPLEIQSEQPELVPRFMAVAMSNVEVKPSPIWLQALLTRIGIKPISNVVDITNYLSYITAQPLHVYDYDKVKERSSGDAKLIVRKPNDNETVVLLNGKTIKPRSEAIMIATDKELVGIGGVMGGTTTEVDSNTKNIIIEVANFDMYSIRRTSMAHGLFTDAVTRFNKGQSPLQNDRVIAKAMEMMSDHAGAAQASKVLESPQFENQEAFVQHIEPKFINDRLGVDLSISEMETLLTNVEFDVSVGEDLGVRNPFWRTDIHIREDIVEEIGRLLGYDKLAQDLPKRVVTPTKVDQILELKKQLRGKLASLGANEVFTYSFVHSKLLEKVGQDPSIAFRVTNALSPDLQYYRLSLTPSLLNHVHSNIKAGHDQFALFELGKVHSKTEIDEDGVPREFGRVSLVLADKLNTQPAYYMAKRYVDELTRGAYNIIPYDLTLAKGHKLMEQMLLPYDAKRSALLMKDELIVGVVGEFKMEVVKAFKLPANCAGIEMFLSFARAGNSKVYTPLSRYPSSSQDVCFEVDDNLSYSEIATAVDNALKQNLSEDQYVRFEPIDIYTSDELPGKKRTTFRITLASYDRTLTDEVFNSLLDEVTKLLHESLKANRV